MKKILYVDMDNVLVDFPSGIIRLPNHIAREFEGRFDEAPRIFAMMDPVAHAIDAYTELASLFDTYILSTAPWKNPSAWSDKLEWVQRHLKDYARKRLILTHHKNLNEGDFLVDDRTTNGADKFKGELIVFGSEQFPDWPAVTRYLRGKV